VKAGWRRGARRADKGLAASELKARLMAERLLLSRRFTGLWSVFWHVRLGFVFFKVNFLIFPPYLVHQNLPMKMLSHQSRDCFQQQHSQQAASSSSGWRLRFREGRSAARHSREGRHPLPSLSADCNVGLEAPLPVPAPQLMVTTGCARAATFGPKAK